MLLLLLQLRMSLHLYPNQQIKVHYNHSLHTHVGTNYYINYVTDNPLTKPPKSRDLLTQVASKARDKLERIGLALGIKQDQLNTILEKRKDVILCYSDVFTVWEKTVDPTDFTWATIVEALESPIVEENKLARDIVQWLTR